jgi:putative endonuclease
MKPKELGRRGEEEAARFLESRGWTILGRNVRVGRREVDLIVARHHVLVFVEVKSRSGESFGDPLEAITPKKRREIARAAAGWLREHSPSGAREIRFDAVGVTWPRRGPPRIRHIPDAWRME